MKKDILVIGSSNVDLIMKMERLPEKGETLTDCTFMQTFGGKGANQAVAAARSGGKVSFVSCVGDDDFGHSMIANYQNDSIATDFVFKIKGVPSGTALIMIGGDGNNYISVAPGANYALEKQHIDTAREVIQGSGLILLQFEILKDTLQYVLDTAHEASVPSMLNFAPAKQLDPQYLTMVSILVLNETEAQYLTGIPAISPDNASDAAKHLLAKGIKSVIITLGINGSYVCSEDFTGFVPAFKVKAIDTTAAGDVYCGSLATALMEGMPFQSAVRFSSAAAALCVTKMGAQISAPTRKDIDNFMNINA